MSLTYVESVADNGDSQASFNFASDLGSANGNYRFLNSDNNINNLQQCVTDILGYVNTKAYSPKLNLNRQIPLRHPAFPYLYASQLSGINGTGRATATAQPAVPVPSGEPYLLTSNPITNTFGVYPNYELKVTFTTRPYNILSDAAVTTGMSSYFPPVSSSQPGSPVRFKYAAEWCRYNSWILQPQNNNIQSGVGAMSFKGAGSGVGFPTQEYQFTSPPFAYMPDGLLTMTAFNFPYRYITSFNSYFTYNGYPTVGMGQSFLGCVNQNDWFNWKAGSLLFLNYQTKIYNQPFPQIAPVADLNSNEWSEFTKVCDITMTFLHTNRTPGTIPALPANNNWIAAGHNLQPFFGTNLANYNRTFEYATAGSISAKTPPAQWFPTWKSAPFELLLTDPDINPVM